MKDVMYYSPVTLFGRELQLDGSKAGKPYGHRGLLIPFSDMGTAQVEE